MAIFEGNFFAAFSVTIPIGIALRFLGRKHYRRDVFSVPRHPWLLSKGFGIRYFLRFCFTSFDIDIEHLTFAVRVFLTIHSFTRNFATIFWENHSFLDILDPKNLYGWCYRVGFLGLFRGVNSKRMLTLSNFPQSAITTRPTSSAVSSKRDEVYTTLIMPTSDMDEPLSDATDTFRHPFLSA